MSVIRQELLRFTTVKLLAALVVFHNVNMCKGELPQCVVDEVTAACRLCDAQVGFHFDDVSTNFYGISGDSSMSLINVSRMHCRRFHNISNCYTDCLRGFNYTYSNNVTQLTAVSVGVCDDTGCNLAYIPGCYAINSAQLFSGLGYSASGCDPTTNTTLASITQCIDLYASQQNCTGTCTTGQRTLKWFKLVTDIACKIPIQSAVCTAEVQFCVFQTYGFLGEAFLSGRILTATSGEDICSHGRRFSACMTNTVNGTFALGSAPCLLHSSAIEQLVAVSDAIFRPFCDNPSQNFTSLCALDSTTAQSRCRKRKR